MSLTDQQRLVTNISSAALCLLSGPFVLKDGRRQEIPEGSKRLLVFVTLNGGRVSRRHAAGMLWSCGDDERAAGNLRSALWRLRGAGIDVLHADKYILYLGPEVSVDITELSRWAQRVIDGTAAGSDLAPLELNPEAVDLLPGWYDEWVTLERERLRQKLLHAMESLARQLISKGLFAEAVEVAVRAVGVEPLRESAQRVLIEAHLAEGNFVEARRAYMVYTVMLAAELGVTPGVELADMVGCGVDSTGHINATAQFLEARSRSLTSSRRRELVSRSEQDLLSRSQIHQRR
jgi:DNA-binding SARP family transcriptional activator